jgi:hypothetical protein
VILPLNLAALRVRGGEKKASRKGVWRREEEDKEAVADRWEKPDMSSRVLDSMSGLARVDSS